MPLEQHAVPTQVTSYEFRLVGDMTLKQFGWLAGGIVIALLIYASPLPGYLKWPLVIFFAPLGALIAFVPFEGRGIDRWVIAFIKAAYSPTEFIWHQERPVPEFFTDSKGFMPSGTTAKVAELDQTKLEEYIQTLPAAHSDNVLDVQESQQLKNIDNLLAGSTPQPTPIPASTVSPVAAIASSSDSSQEPSPFTPSLNSVTTEATYNFSPAPSITPFPGGSVDQAEAPPPLDLDLKAVTSDQPPVPTEPVPTSTPATTTSSWVPSSSPIDPSIQGAMAQSHPSLQTSDDPSASIAAEFSQHLPLPTPPTTPNIVVGMVTDNQGKIVEGAIIEIKDQNNKPVRALKTNKLGQFAIATPLKNGSYMIEIEKSGLGFERLSFTAAGAIIPPIAIRAHG